MKRIILGGLITASVMLGANEEVNIKTPVNCDKFLQIADDSLNIAIEEGLTPAARSARSLEASALMQRYEICKKYSINESLNNIKKTGKDSQ